MTTRSVSRAGALAGAIGASIMVLAQALLRATAGIPMFPDLLEDTLTQLIPAPIFARVLDTLKFQAKPLLFISVLLGQVVLGALAGLLFARIGGLDPPRSGERWRGWAAAAGASLLLWLVDAVLVLPVAGKGPFGAYVAGGSLALNLGLLVSFLLFGLVTAAVFQRLTAQAPSLAPTEPAEATTASPARRRLLGDLAAAGFAVVSVAVAYRLALLSEPPASATPSVSPPAAIPTTPTSAAVVAAETPAASTNASAPAAAATPGGVSAMAQATAAAAEAVGKPVAVPVEPPEWLITGLVPEVTLTKDFYVVSKNFFSDPVVDSKRWTLEISGQVKKPYHLNYQQLLNLPWQERYQTLECISNEIGGDLISNGSWRGVSLRDVIAAAEPEPGAKKAVFSAADGYTDSVTFDRAMSPANLLAYNLNGQPLEPGHGAPARLLVPGIYGMKNVKWLTKIEIVNTDVQGYWQQRGWSDQAFINTMSRIDVPTGKDGGLHAGKVELAGIAFSGDKGISKVEISADGGKTWQAALLKEPLGPYTWRLWKLEWNAAAGSYTLVVRATDGTGQVQTSEQTDTLPNGATGWHTVQVRVA